MNNKKPTFDELKDLLWRNKRSLSFDSEFTDRSGRANTEVDFEASKEMQTQKIRQEAVPPSEAQKPKA